MTPWKNRSMTRRSVVRGSVRALLLLVLASVVGQLVAKRMTVGDEDSDAFTLAAIFGGKEFKSRATPLRSGSALAVMGGVDLDLRSATLDPAGGTLNVTTVMGGAHVTVPRGWVVEVESRGNLGGVDSKVTDAADLPDGAPTLHVTTNTWFGGVQVTE